MKTLSVLTAPSRRIQARKVVENDLVVLAGIGVVIKVKGVEVDRCYAVVSGTELGSGKAKSRTFPKDYCVPVVKP